MAASILEQVPYGVFVPVGQDLIFVVSNQTAVLNETRVKFVAEVYIGTSQAAVNPSANNSISLVKVSTPASISVSLFSFLSLTIFDITVWNYEPLKTLQI